MCLCTTAWLVANLTDWPCRVYGIGQLPGASATLYHYGSIHEILTSKPASFLVSSPIDPHSVVCQHSRERGNMAQGSNCTTVPQAPRLPTTHLDLKQMTPGTHNVDTGMRTLRDSKSRSQCLNLFEQRHSLTSRACLYWHVRTQLCSGAQLLTANLHITMCASNTPHPM